MLIDSLHTLDYEIPTASYHRMDHDECVILFVNVLRFPRVYSCRLNSTKCHVINAERATKTGIAVSKLPSNGKLHTGYIGPLSFV